MARECWKSKTCPNVMEDMSCEKDCVWYNAIRQKMTDAGIPSTKQKIIGLVPEPDDVDAFMQLADIKHNIWSFVKTGKNLLIQSNETGNGKTSWAIKLLMSFCAESYDHGVMDSNCIFVDTALFLAECKNFDTQDDEFRRVKKLLKTADLVVWDDIGSTKMSAYDYSQLFAYINYRMTMEMSNIFTTNINEDEMLQIFGARIADRFIGCDFKIQIVGGSRR